jgi:hypothetical protein
MATPVHHLVFSKAKKYRLARHAVFWLVYFCVFQVMDYGEKPFRSFESSLCYLPFTLLFVYLVLYRLVPRLLMKYAYWSFFAWYCVCLLCCLSLDYFWGLFVVHRYWLVSNTLTKPGFWRTIAAILGPANFTVTNFMAGLGVGIEMYKFWRGEVWLKCQVAQEKTQAELELLKSQLHPQFLYNTLENLQSLVDSRSPRAPAMLMRLSAILSYVLYECQAAEVPLEREIAICKDYITLERERYGNRLDISIDAFGRTAGQMIAPLLLQPFIENAFTAVAQERGVRIWMSLEMSVQDNQFLLRVVTGGEAHALTDRKLSHEAATETLIRRLNLLYPGRHCLTYKKMEDVDIFSLTIYLASNTARSKDQAEPAPLADKHDLLQYAVFNY